MRYPAEMVLSTDFKTLAKYITDHKGHWPIGEHKACIQDEALGFKYGLCAKIIPNQNNDNEFIDGSNLNRR
jgi:hypothetical protein